jgi:hypothetical protein
MMTKILAEVKKMFRYWWTHKALALVSIFPPLLLCLLFVGAFQTTGEANLVVVNQDTDNLLTREFIEVLASDEGTIPHFNLTITDEETAETMFQMHETFAVLTIPSGFGESLNDGTPESLEVEFTAVHEDISKNVRLGIEARIYDFIKVEGLDTGERPGIIVSETLAQGSLARSDYMMGGIVIWTMMFFGLLVGAALGASEKQEGTGIYIEMAADGNTMSVLGKWLAAIAISAVMMLVMLSTYVLLFGLSITSLGSLLWIGAIFLAMTTMFSFPGVLYGVKVGDFRLIPAPMIILSITLWIVSGALNPLEFSAGAPVFKYLPTSASIRLITYSLFNRGEQFVSESIKILASWLGIVLLGATLWFFNGKRRKAVI